MVVQLIKPKKYIDHRGYFSETYSRRSFSDLDIQCEFVQHNHSLSHAVGTVRGLHFQAPPHAQAKLVRCGRGAIFDVAVDIRKGSPSYGHWVGYELSAENGYQLFVPVGYAHGFITLEADSEIVYQCSNYYAVGSEGTLRWDDPDIGIDWPLREKPTVSDKDRVSTSMKNFDSPFTYEAAK